MRSRIVGTGMLLAPLLAGCPGGGDDGGGTGGAICRAVGNSSYVSTSSNPSGTFTDPTLAFDGHLDSYAELSPAASASGTIGGGGLERPARDVAGMVFARPASGSLTVQITTYRENVPLDSTQAAANFTPTGQQSTCPSRQCFERDGLVFYGVEATLAYDRIEATISMSGLPEPLRIHELCVVD